MHDMNNIFGRVHVTLETQRVDPDGDYHGRRMVGLASIRCYYHERETALEKWLDANRGIVRTGMLSAVFKAEDRMPIDYRQV